MLLADKAIAEAAEINGGFVAAEISLKSIEISMHSKEISIGGNGFL